MTSPLQSFARRGTVLVASLATAALGLAVSPAVADPGGSGSISGTVAFADAAPMTDDVYATAYRFNSDDEVQGWEPAGGTVVGLDGDYDIPLADGAYRVEFRDIDGAYVSEYYDDARTLELAEDVDVSLDAPATGIDAILAEAGRITGEVTDDSSDPLADITVTAETASGERIATTSTNGGGGYELNGLPAGSYVLEFSDRENFEYVAEFYDDAATFEEADPVTVTAGGTSSGNHAELATGSTIDGTITGQAGAIEGAFVDIFKQVAGEWEYVAYEGSGALTDELGHYELSGLAAGDYRLEFWAPGHVAEFYENAATLEGAQSVGLAVADSETVDAYLDVTSSITGTMTTVAGEPAVGGQVTVWGGTEDESFYYGSALTDEDGNYVVEDLAAGSYVVEFDYDDGADYFFEFWDDAQSFVAATPVVVEADGVVTDQIDAVMDDKTVAQVQNLTLPTISGVPKVGSTLTADPGTWDQPGATFDYQWETYEEGQQHTDFLASGRTYVPTADIVGQQLWVTVVASVPGVEDGYASSELVGPVTGAPVVLPPVVAPPVVTTPLTKVDDTHKPQVTGAKKVGSTLKAKAASWVPAGAKVKYQWLVNGKVVKKATKAKLKLLAKFAGKKISVKVTATSPGSLPVSVVTKAGKVGKVGKGKR